MNILTLDSSQLEASLALFSNDKKVHEIHYSRERRLSMYLVHDISKITQETKLRAARGLAALVKKPKANNIIPDLLDKRVVKAIAKSVHY